MTHVYRSDYRNKDRAYPDPFPVHTLKRVDRPTTLINDDQVARVDERDGGFQRAGRGEYGRRLQEEYGRFMPKYPLSGAQLAMSRTLAAVVDGPIESGQAPLPRDPGAISRHIKETAYFLRADLVGVCELPPYAVFTHSR